MKNIYTNKKGLKDIAVKTIFGNEDSKEYICMIISVILGIDKEYLMHNLEFVQTDIGNNVNSKNAVLDALYQTNNLIINIEYNNFKSGNLLNKNLRYVFKLYVDSFAKNEYKNKNTVQINFDYFDYFGNNKLIYEIGLYEKNINALYSDGLKIYSVNLEKLNKMNYNDVKEKGKKSLEYLAYILVPNAIDKLKDIYNNDKLMNGMVDKMSDISKKTLEELYYDKDELNKLIAEELSFKKGIEEGITQGIEQGITQGIEQKNLSTIKNMLDKKCEPEFIMDMLNLTKEEYDIYLNKLK